MREIKTHKVNEANDRLSIQVMDEPVKGMNASHLYVVSGYNARGNKANADIGDPPPGDYTEILFQNGPIGDVGLNGITHEALLAIVIDRLRSFQAGDYACRENAIALTKLEEAQHWLLHRTRDRMLRGVEGTTSL